MTNLPSDTTDPAPIEWHKFLPISELLELKGITDSLDDDSEGLKKVKGAIWRAYDDYCKTHRVDHQAEGQTTGARCELGCPTDVHFTFENGYVPSVARAQNLIPSFPWIAPGWRAWWGHNPREGRDQILQRSIAEP